MDVIILWLITFMPSGMIGIIILRKDLKLGIFYISFDATENNAAVRDVQIFFLVHWYFLIKDRFSMLHLFNTQLQGLFYPSLLCLHLCINGKL